MTAAYWAIDKSLQLDRLEALPPGVSAVDPPEQSIDIVLLRNLSLLTKELLGSPGRFVFHSTDYWGPFDVGCVLADGRVVAFENKGAALDKKGFDKFCCDVVFVRNDPSKYLEHRFEHVRAGVDYYIKTARQMFAGFFLGIRADTRPSNYDLVPDAAKKLSAVCEKFMSCEDFLANFDRGNQWLDEVRNHACFQEYMGGFAPRIEFEQIVPILLVPENRVERVQGWISKLSKRYAAEMPLAGSCSPAPSSCWKCTGRNGTVARLAGYRFFARTDRKDWFPEWLSTCSPSEFTV